MCHTSHWDREAYIYGRRARGAHTAVDAAAEAVPLDGVVSIPFE
jgi:hypothetical protein